MNVGVSGGSDPERIFLEIRGIAEAVLGILKELHRESRKQIDSHTLTEKMTSCDAIIRIINEIRSSCPSPERLSVVSAIIVKKLVEIVPESLSETQGRSGSGLHFNPERQDFREWIELPFQVIKDYLNREKKRNSELEEFTKQTMSYLTETERHILSEMSLNQQKFQDDRDFEENISHNMACIKDNITVSEDFNAVKMAVMSTIENIKKGIDMKREKDREQFRETEKNLEDMTRRMTEIKKEADAMRKRSEEIEFQSVHDYLTGLYNRRAYDLRMTETLAHVKRYGITASLMVCDIDYFKKINDTYGHKIGDLALKKLASLIRERLRINDFVARYGGEEFAIIMPHTDMQGALRTAEGIRSYIASAIFAYKDLKIPLTISIGVSLFRGGDSSASVFERADAALYLAKRSGRNRVRCEDDIPADLPA
ncbi:MAG: diguanylate cyclase [Nitrospiraceae bacterium]|nr:MAG: diguanylate cyclase [Nitrospiraceae bacterium]